MKDPEKGSGEKLLNMAWLVFSEEVRMEVLEVLDESDVAFYSLWRGVLTKDNEGENANTRWDDAVFPGKNMAVQIVCDEPTLTVLAANLKLLLREEHVARSGLSLHVQPTRNLLE